MYENQYAIYKITFGITYIDTYKMCAPFNMCSTIHDSHTYVLYHHPPGINFLSIQYLLPLSLVAWNENISYVPHCCHPYSPSPSATQHCTLLFRLLVLYCNNFSVGSHKLLEENCGDELLEKNRLC